MRKRALGKTGIEVSELALGTWGLAGHGYGPVPEGESRRVAERARAMGITLFETADCYARGRIEEELGEVLKGSDATVVTKWGTDLESAPAQKHFDPEFIVKSAEASRKRLGDVRVIGLLHNPSPTALKAERSIQALRDLTEKGEIFSWGISVSDEEGVRAAMEHSPPVLSIPYNVFHVRPFRAVSEQVENLGTAVLAHTVLFYGLLAGRWGPTKEFRSYDHRSERWASGALRTRVNQLEAVRPLVSGDVTTMRSAAVRFVLEQPLISSAILGPRNSIQLDQLVRECKAEPPYLSAGKMNALEGRLRELEVPR